PKAASDGRGGIERAEPGKFAPQKKVARQAHGANLFNSRRRQSPQQAQGEESAFLLYRAQATDVEPAMGNEPARVPAAGLDQNKAALGIPSSRLPGDPLSAVHLKRQSHGGEGPGRQIIVRVQPKADVVVDCTRSL